MAQFFSCFIGTLFLTVSNYWYWTFTLLSAVEKVTFVLRLSTLLRMLNRTREGILNRQDRKKSNVNFMFELLPAGVRPLREAISRKRQDWSRYNLWQLYHDNAPAHTRLKFLIFWPKLVFIFSEHGNVLFSQN